MNIRWCLVLLLLFQGAVLADSEADDGASRGEAPRGRGIVDIEDNDADDGVPRRLLLRHCRVVFENDDQALVRGYVGLLDDEKKTVLIVLIPERFGVGTIRLKARYRNHEITKAKGESLALAGARGMVLKCEAYDKIKSALDESYVKDRSDDFVITIRTLTLKKRQFEESIEKAKASTSRGGGRQP